MSLILPFDSFLIHFNTLQHGKKKCLVGKNNAGQKNGSVNQIGVKYSTFFYNFIVKFWRSNYLGRICVCGRIWEFVGDKMG
jgi:hypothetical protein